MTHHVGTKILKKHVLLKINENGLSYTETQEID
jgi:hypothetical protein